MISVCDLFSRIVDHKITEGIMRVWKQLYGWEHDDSLFSI